MAGRTFINGKEILNAEDLTLTDDLIVGDDADITDDMTVGGTLDVTGVTTLTGRLKPNDGIQAATGKALHASTSPAAYGGIYMRNSAQTVDAPFITTGTTSNHYVICENADDATDFGHAQSTDPMFIFQSADATDITQFGSFAWNSICCGAGKGACLDRESATEEVTIAAGAGAAGVASSANLAPANAYIKEIITRVTQAPGGGATTLDAGRTNGGNLDEATDGTAVTLGTTTMANNDGDGNTTFPVWEAGADTITLTTDVNVTGADMKVRVTVFYDRFTAHTA